MSVAEGLKRILDIRNAIRSKMTTLGLSQDNDNFDKIRVSVESIVDNTKKTDTSTAIQGIFSSGQVGAVFSKGLKGYSSDESLVKVPVANLAPENIKEGVNIGGVVGTVRELPQKAFKGKMYYKANASNSSSDNGNIYDATGLTDYKVAQTSDLKEINIIGNIVMFNWQTVSNIRDVSDCEVLHRNGVITVVLITGQNPKIGIGVNL